MNEAFIQTLFSIENQLKRQNEVLDKLSKILEPNDLPISDLIYKSGVVGEASKDAIYVSQSDVEIYEETFAFAGRDGKSEAAKT